MHISSAIRGTAGYVASRINPIELAASCDPRYALKPIQCYIKEAEARRIQKPQKQYTFYESIRGWLRFTKKLPGDMIGEILGSITHTGEDDEDELTLISCIREVHNERQARRAKQEREQPRLINPQTRYL